MMPTDKIRPSVNLKKLMDECGQLNSNLIRANIILGNDQPKEKGLEDM